MRTRHPAPRAPTPAAVTRSYRAVAGGLDWVAEAPPSADRAPVAGAEWLVGARAEAFDPPGAHRHREAVDRAASLCLYWLSCSLEAGASVSCTLRSQKVR